MQVRDSHPPRFPYGLISARHRPGADMCHPVEGTIITRQKLTAPDCAVSAEAGAVEDHAQNGTIEPMLGHATRQVRVMVLYRELLASVRLSISRRRIVGVHIVNEQFRLDRPE